MRLRQECVNLAAFPVERERVGPSLRVQALHKLQGSRIEVEGRCIPADTVT